MRWLRAIPLVGAWVMLVISGAYVGIYLYRWEWNRALTAGVFFLAAQLFVSTVVVLRRLRDIEARLADGGAAAAPQRSEEHRAEEELHAADDGDLTAELSDALTPRTELPWLRGGGDQYGVFIPILLGAGVVLSALAWLVERAATAVATTGRARHRARTGRAAPRSDRSRPWVRWTAAIAMAGVIGIGAVAVDALGDLTQTRPDLPRPQWETVVTVQVVTRPGVDAATGAADLWGACRHLLDGSDTTTSRGPGASLAATVRPAVGHYLRRQLVGCLEDATIDHVQGRVTAIVDQRLT